MVEILIIIGLLVVGYLVGSQRERQHYKSIEEREQDLRGILVFDTQLSPEQAASKGELVKGNVVVSVDYFKRFVAGLRKIFGGQLRSYETLLDRGRREAILRMKEEADVLGANAIFNVRFETSSISQGAEQALGSVEVLAYGTAIKRDRSS